ncbi:MAG: SDR family oxidoreductase [Acidimicrobiia bacterium]
MTTISDLLSYRGKRAVVTGAASGMGLSCVERLTELGAEVVALDLVAPARPVAQFIELDVRDPASIEAATSAIDGPIHALFNVVGVPPAREAIEVFTINFIGPRYLTELLVPKMTEGSAIANVATVLVGRDETRSAAREALAVDGFGPLAAWAAANPDKLVEGYMFSKACFTEYTVQQAPRLIEQGIRINIIGPSTTDTPFLDALHAVMPGISDPPTAVIGRRSTAAEQADVLVFLNSGVPTYMTGAVIANDGGYTAALDTGQL